MTNPLAYVLNIGKKPQFEIVNEGWLNKPVIIISVPHAECVSYMQKEHWCDFITKKMIYHLIDELAETFRVVAIINRKTRWTADQNRKHARREPFRRKLRKLIKQHKKNLWLHIDLHSYGSYDPDWKKYDITLLKPTREFGFAEKKIKFTHDLAEALREEDLDVGHIQIKKIGDIILTLHRHVPRTVLLEVNEKWIGAEKTICKKLASAITSVRSQRPS